MSRSLAGRVLFALTAFAVVWLVSARANAAEASVMSVVNVNASFAPPPPPPVAPIVADDRAPLCDPRGAITFASAPQMQDVEASVDSGLTLDDCMSPAPGDARHAAPGHAPVPPGASSASSDAACHIAIIAKLARAARELTPAPAASTSCSRPGFRSTVDRPPRV